MAKEIKDLNCNYKELEEEDLYSLVANLSEEQRRDLYRAISDCTGQVVCDRASAEFADIGFYG